MRLAILLIIFLCDQALGSCRDQGFGGSGRESSAPGPVTTSQLASRGFATQRDLRQVRVLTSSDHPTVNQLMTLAKHGLKRDIAITGNPQKKSDGDYIYLGADMFSGNQGATSHQLDAAVAVGILEGMHAAVKTQRDVLERYQRLEIYLPTERDYDGIIIYAGNKPENRSTGMVWMKVANEAELNDFVRLAMGQAEGPQLGYTNRQNAYRTLIQVFEAKLMVAEHLIAEQLERMRSSDQLAQGQMSQAHAEEIQLVLQQFATQLEGQFFIYQSDIP